jgi:hypothetical protein
MDAKAYVHVYTYVCVYVCVYAGEGGLPHLVAWAGKVELVALL